MSTLFVAVQCFQCSTMQVKQQKKSSNKWVCVVCNQRQSVRRIHAQGPLARDLRHFVQAFNMSRSDGPHPIPPPHPSDRAFSPMALAEHGGAANRGKRRMDWTEYLDPQDEKDEAGGGGEPEMATELPPKMLRPSLPKCPPRMPAAAAGRENKPLKPNFSKKNKDETRLPESTEPKGGRIPVAAKARSKWSEYLEGSDGCFQGEEFSNQSSDQEPWGGREKYKLAGVRVEEEVHPDFQ